MLKSVLLSLVSVMLCIIVTFSAFGIELHPTAFFTDLLKVEGFVGDTADTILSARDKMQIFAKEWLPKVKEAFKPILDIFDSLRDFFVELDERFAILDSISTWFENLLVDINTALNYINVFVRYCSEYGLGLFDDDWWNGLSTSWSAYVNGFAVDENGKLDYEAMTDVVDAFVHGENNRFSYLVHETESVNVSSAPLNKNTIVWHQDTSYFWFAEETIDNADYWAVCSDLSIPRNYAPYLSNNLKFDYYLSYYWIPISNSNMVYVVDGLDYYLTGIRLVRWNKEMSGKFNAFDDVKYPFTLHKTDVYYELEFSLIYQGTVVTSVWIPPEEFFVNDVDQPVYKASVLPGRFVREDENERYSDWDFTE